MDMDAIVAGQQDAAQEDSLWHRAKVRLRTPGCSASAASPCAGISHSTDLAARQVSQLDVVGLC